MIHQVICPDCGKELIRIEKDQVSQDEKDMYSQNSSCNICTSSSENTLYSVNALTNKLLRALNLKDR